MDACKIILELENQVEKINNKLIRNRCLNISNQYVRISFYEYSKGFFKYNSSIYLDSIEKEIISCVCIKPTYNEKPIRVSLFYLGKYREEKLYPVKNNKYYTGYTKISKFLTSLEKPEELNCLLFKNFWIFVNSEELQKIRKDLEFFAQQTTNHELANDIMHNFKLPNFNSTNYIEITFYTEATLADLF
jgi:hypothetical protein